MRTKVTELGVLLPKEWFEGVDEVEIRQEQNAIVVVPVGHDDAAGERSKYPVTVEEDAASINHDHYLYTLLASVTEGNIHAEVSVGGPDGNEAAKC